VILVSAKGSSKKDIRKFQNKKNTEKNERSSTLTVIETVEPSWDDIAEKYHYRVYKDLLEKKFGSGEGIVWDNTWHCYSYLSARNFPKMKILHTQHGILERLRVSIRDFKFPRFLGLSKPHAEYMSSTLKIPVRYVHNGIPLPNLSEQNDANNIFSGSGNNEMNNKQYLLSLNRIIPEKGIDDAIDVAVETRNHIKVAGGDRFSPKSYVEKIIQKCKNSKGYAEYYGLVDNPTKIGLIKNCKAVISCPKPIWMEAFGLYAVEANAYGKPVLALSNGGLNDIILNGVNGFLAETPEKLKKYVDKLEGLDPQACRKRVEEMFTDEIMTNNYLSIFKRVVDDNPESRW
jgi:glycosyltransferase involved in cell wall biosynthesis